MKNLISVILLFSLIIIGCENNSTIAPTATTEQDVPCLPQSNIYIGNSDTIGLGGTVNWSIVNNHLYLLFNSPLIDNKTIHIQVDTTAIHTVGNLPPGSMSFSINNVQSGITYDIPLNLTVRCKWWLYIHIDMNGETAWAGNYNNKKLPGNGGLRWWSTNPCTCN